MGPGKAEYMLCDLHHYIPLIVHVITYIRTKFSIPHRANLYEQFGTQSHRDQTVTEVIVKL